MPAGQENNPDRIIEYCKAATELDDPIDMGKLDLDCTIHDQKIWQSVKDQITKLN